MQLPSGHPWAPGPSRPPTSPRSAPPTTARLAGVLGVLGALVLAALALHGLALDGDDGDVDDPFVPSLALAAVLHLVSAVWLLRRRRWWPLVLCALPSVLALGWLVALAAVGFLSGQGADGLDVLLSLGPWLAISPAAAALALTPTSRRWVAERRAST
jgi:hypothetical protein